MTPTLNTACVAETAPVAAAVELAAAEQVLRDMAYVLKLTRRVKHFSGYSLTSGRDDSESESAFNKIGLGATIKP